MKKAFNINTSTKSLETKISEQDRNYNNKSTPELWTPDMQKPRSAGPQQSAFRGFCKPGGPPVYLYVSPAPEQLYPASCSGCTGCTWCSDQVSDSGPNSCLERNNERYRRERKRNQRSREQNRRSREQNYRSRVRNRRSRERNRRSRQRNQKSKERNQKSRELNPV